MIPPLFFDVFFFLKCSPWTLRQPRLGYPQGTYQHFASCRWKVSSPLRFSMRTTGDWVHSRVTDLSSHPQGNAREMYLETRFWNRCFTMIVIQIPVDKKYIIVIHLQPWFLTFIKHWFHSNITSRFSHMCHWFWFIRRYQDGGRSLRMLTCSWELLEQLGSPNNSHVNKVWGGTPNE